MSRCNAASSTSVFDATQVAIFFTARETKTECTFSMITGEPSDATAAVPRDEEEDEEDEEEEEEEEEEGAARALLRARFDAAKPIGLDLATLFAGSKAPEPRCIDGASGGWDRCIVGVGERMCGEWGWGGEGRDGWVGAGGGWTRARTNLKMAQRLRYELENQRLAQKGLTEYAAQLQARLVAAAQKLREVREAGPGGGKGANGDGDDDDGDSGDESGGSRDLVRLV